MESLSPQGVAASKLPILNPNEFDLWKMRIKKYFLMTDYSLWEVILNGDFLIPTRVVDGVVQPIAPTTAEQRLAKKNELKARETLLMALPYKHQLKFNIHKDAITIGAFGYVVPEQGAFGVAAAAARLRLHLGAYVIQQSRAAFGLAVKTVGNAPRQYSAATHIFGVLHAKSLMEAIEKRFGRNKETKKLQKTLLKQDLPSEWKTHTLIWRNKADMEDQSLDDLFNNLKIYEEEVKSSSFTTQNIAFVSSQNTDSTNESSNSLQLDNDDIKQIDADDLKEMDLKWQMVMLTMRARSVIVLVAKIGAFRQMKNQQTMPSWHSPPQVLQVLIMRKSQFDVLSYKIGLESVEARLVVYQQNENVFEEDMKLLKLDVMLRDNALVELRKKFEAAKNERDELKLKLEKFQTSLKNLNVSMPTSLVHDRYKSGEGYHSVPPPYTGTFMPPKRDWVFYDAPTANEIVPTILNFKSSTTKPNKDLSQSNRPSAPIIKDWVYDSEDEYEVEHPTPAENLRKYILKPRGHRHSWNRKACFVCKSLTHLIKDCDYYEKKMVQKPVRNNVMRGTHQHYVRMIHPHPYRHVVPTSVLTRSRLVPLTTARPVTNVVPQTKMQHQMPTKHGNLQHALKDKGVIDSGCSRHMTGNISYLSNFEEINGGYVAFGGNPKGGKIISKDKIRTGELDFNEKKNNVLFIDTECVVLSSDFKLPNENHVLLRVLRENNMYNVNLKNIVSLGDLTCLFAKATLDDSNICHRRLGSGPTWLFNIDTLTQSMNYQLVVAGHQPNSTAGIQENLNADPQNTDDDAFEVKEPESAVHVFPSSCDKTKKHDDKTKREAKGKSLVELSIGVKDLSDEFEEFSNNSTNTVNAGSTLVTAVGPNLTNSTNTFSAADMPTLEDIAYLDDEEDVGAQAEFYNLETNITVSPIPTTRVYKDHLVTQIIDPSWIEAMQEELLQFKMQKGHTQEEGIDYKEVFAPVVRIEAIRLFLAYASFMGFMVYQMDVKSAFLYGTIKEEVYVYQPLGFEDPDYPNKGNIDQTLFIKKQKGDILMVQVYVDDIIFRSTNKDLCKVFEKLMKDKFQMSSIGELTFFLGLQVKQKQDGMFISQDKYIAKILRKFGLTDGKSASTPIDTEKPLLKDPDYSPFNLVAYSDSDYAGASLDRKSTTGGCQFLVDEKDRIETSVSIKKSNDVVKLQALIDRKKTVISEDSIRQALRLNDADNIDCLPNEELFAELDVEDVVEDEDDVNEVYVEPTPPSPTPATPPPPPQPKHIPLPPQPETSQPSHPPQQQPSQTAKISMTLLKQLLETCATLTKQVANLEQDKVAQAIKITKLKQMEGKIAASVANEDVTLETMDADIQGMLPESQAKVYHIDLKHAEKVLSMQDTDEAELVEVEEVKSKDKGKGIIVEEPKPLKRQAQIEQDKAFARELEAKLNANINWSGVVDQVKKKERKDSTVMRYQALKRKPVTKAQARKNMMIVQLILFIVDSGCTKHMTGYLSLLCNFVEKYMGTVRFGNDQFAPIISYRDLVQGNITINRVYFVEGLNHNLFLVGQFCDADLKVAFRKSTCFVRDL
uniref:Reverse transcriptase Ty1/copia-type domain-containing protein n=1 Tax=Tanacetum cinerariifolium TaxID=118510 RepID=A0A6L2JSZ1_TANCI|nr:hypothetical protein [Tanacetum cinerariifolium]